MAVKSPGGPSDILRFATTRKFVFFFFLCASRCVTLQNLNEIHAGFCRARGRSRVLPRSRSIFHSMPQRSVTTLLLGTALLYATKNGGSTNSVLSSILTFEIFDLPVIFSTRRPIVAYRDWTKLRALLVQRRVYRYRTLDERS